MLGRVFSNTLWELFTMILCDICDLVRSDNLKEMLQHCLLRILHLLSVEMDLVLPKMFCQAKRVVKWSMLDAKALYLLAEIHYLFCCEFFGFILCIVIRFIHFHNIPSLEFEFMLDGSDDLSIPTFKSIHGIPDFLLFDWIQHFLQG